MQYSLFYSPFCYFCHKVLNVLDQNNGNAITLLNVNEGDNASTLRQGGGKTQVPCLRIESSSSGGDDQSSVKWLYESDDIIDYFVEQGLIAS